MICVRGCVNVCVCVQVREGEDQEEVNKETDNVSFTSSCEARDLLWNPWKGARLFSIYICSQCERQPKR